MPARIEKPVRVFVTAVGAITSQGKDSDCLWQGSRAGCVAIRPVRNLPMQEYSTRLGGEVATYCAAQQDYARPPDFRDRALDFAMIAAAEAMEKCAWLRSLVAPENWGVIIGTCNAGLLSGREWYQQKRQKGRSDARLLPLITPQALAEALGAAFNLQGPMLSVSTACAAGANALGYGADLIRFGEADAVLAGGADAFSDVLFAGFNCLESLSPEPAAPYSRTRQGLSLGEGSGMLVLLREDIARKHNAPLLAEVMGYGLSADGYHATAPQPEGKGAARAIMAALSSAGITPEKVGYVNGHGTGTAKNDPAESGAIRLGLGEAADHVLVSSTKSMIGHLLGAAGAVEAIVTVKALQEQVAPPTANYVAPDPECDLNYTPNVPRPFAADFAISNNFAFGGANACVVLGRAEQKQAAPPTPDYDRVVITGMSALTGAGCTPEAVWQAFANASYRPPQEQEGRIGRVDLNPAPFLTTRDCRRMDRLSIFAVVASHLALQNAHLAITPENQNRVGAILGTGCGPMESMEKFTRPLLEEGGAAANPAVFPSTVYNAAGGQVAMQAGLLGCCSTVTGGHAAGAAALCYAMDLCARNSADATVCLAVDTLTAPIIAAYRDLGLLTPEGEFALAEAGIALVLERLSHAQQRSAPILGEIVGYGMASDARGVGRFDPQGRGLERAMRRAMEDAGLTVSDIKAIWGSQSGYRAGDSAEARATRRVFGRDAPLFSPRRKLGEPMGAGAALNAILALQSWQQNPVSAAPVLLNSSSLGGTHFAAVLAPFSSP